MLTNYKATFYHSVVLPNTPSLEASVIFRILSFKEIQDLDILHTEHKYNQYLIRVFELSVIYVEIEGHTQDARDLLPYELKKEIATKIVQDSSLSNQNIEDIHTAVDIHFTDILNTATWECSVCQRKGLDQTRNCPLLLNNPNKDKSFRIEVNKVIYTYCPKGNINKDALIKSIEAYNVFKSGFLPDAGGWYDQTQFFCYSSQYVNNKIEEMKSKKASSTK